MTTRQTNAVDPVGMEVPEWEKRELWGAAKDASRRQLTPKSGFILRFTAESEGALWSHQNVKGPFTPVITTLDKSIAMAKRIGAHGVQILTYADSRWLVLAEFPV